MWTEIYHKKVGRAKQWIGTMTTRKRTQITVETDRLLIIRRRTSARAWCPQCDREVDMVGLEEARLLAGISQDALRGGVERLACHLTEAADKSVLICLDSLLKGLRPQAENEKRGDAT
jgi:hypothetical protein